MYSTSVKNGTLHATGFSFNPPQPDTLQHLHQSTPKKLSFFDATAFVVVVNLAVLSRTTGSSEKV